jgi:hypothetical protein
MRSCEIADIMGLKYSSICVCINYMRKHQTLFPKRGRPMIERDEEIIIHSVIADPTLAIRTEAKDLGEPHQLFTWPELTMACITTKPSPSPSPSLGKLRNIFRIGKYSAIQSLRLHGPFRTVIGRKFIASIMHPPPTRLKSKR